MIKNIFLILSFSAILGAVEFNEHDGKNIQRLNPAHDKKTVLSYAESLKEARKSVVNISAQKSVGQHHAFGNELFNDPFFRQFFDSRRFNIPKERKDNSLGSGVIVTKDGYIITNNHVVEGAEKITVTTASNNKEYEAKIIGVDAKSDLAVIKIDGKDFDAITLYDSDSVEVGDVVFAIGNPFAVGQTITQGIVSATNRSSVGIVEYEDFIQTDASINPGNSGGALVNSLGYLIGINSAIITKGGGNIGIGFAIPSNMVKKITKTLIEKGKFQRAYLGVTISDVTDELFDFYGTKEGAIVMTVQKDSAAQIAGIKRGDLIIKINDKSIKDSNMLKNIIGSLDTEQKINIEYLRDGKPNKTDAKLQLMQEESKGGSFYEYEGASISELTNEIKSKHKLEESINGVIVMEVKRDSNAIKAGLLAGDIIVQIERKEIENLKDFQDSTKDKNKKRFFVYRGGAIFVLVL